MYLGMLESTRNPRYITYELVQKDGGIGSNGVLGTFGALRDTGHHPSNFREVLVAYWLE